MAVDVPVRTEPLDVDKLFQALPARKPGVVKRKVFEALTGLDYYALDALWLGRSEVPGNLSARGVMTNLGALLGLRSKEVAGMPGVSESRVSRNDQVTLAILDRTEGVSDTFADVAAVLGFTHARDWLKAPNAALEGAAPYTLLGTHYGQKKVENMIIALLNGAVI